MTTSLTAPIRISIPLILMTAIFAVPGCKSKSKEVDSPAVTADVKQTATDPTAESQKESAPAVAADDGKDWYRAELDFDEHGKMPFFLKLPGSPKKGTALLANGEERFAVAYSWSDGEVSITPPWAYQTEIVASLRDGALVGEWTRNTPLWGEVVREFEAHPVTGPDPKTRFAEAAPPTVDLSGTWHFSFETHGDGKGNFTQSKDGVLSGYIRPAPLGDFRYLAGNVSANRFSLSSFNGNIAHLITAEVAPDGQSLTGMLSMQNIWNEPFTAKRVDEGFDVEPPIRLKEGATRVSIPQLEKFKGKPVIVEIFATWCPNCNDAAPFFRELYDTYHPQGVEMIGLKYDLLEDSEVLDEAFDAYAGLYDGVPWEVATIKTTPQTWAKAMPKELEEWYGFPITLFINTDGTVHQLYAGYYGPAAGEDHKRNKALFRRWTEEIIASGGE